MVLKAPVQVDQDHQSSLASSQPASIESHLSRTSTLTNAGRRSRLQFWHHQKDSSISSEVSTGTGSTKSEMGQISGPISIRLMTDDNITALFGPSGKLTPYQNLPRSRRGSDSSADYSSVDNWRSSQSPLSKQVRSTPRAHCSSPSVPLSSPYSTLAKPPCPPRLRPVMASGFY
ncbi:uncharacterized protein MELLADRAFT_110702 [Melampsora larici-populina 98AG31]|uniref:Uncharacterized protein n=1 Tax=Melampsora larici-populina (strain 98AG31 / pathotype 3-4-7) TaxID=747676 RepID=F4S0N8_MELLP|nr:uncharacterized protein MELLADRAFT_110702 [Melampsora larici-populina 98AG31]EGG01797.1 hypothetical protein MELLADRAFT_110702 [Melampsora larici-populina 98AG31]